LEPGPRLPRTPAVLLRKTGFPASRRRQAVRGLPPQSAVLSMPGTCSVATDLAGKASPLGLGSRTPLDPFYPERLIFKIFKKIPRHEAGNPIISYPMVKVPLSQDPIFSHEPDGFGGEGVNLCNALATSNSNQKPREANKIKKLKITSKPERAIPVTFERVGDQSQRSASTKPGEEAAHMGVARRSIGYWPENSRLTVHGDEFRGHASQAERVAPDVRGWRSTHPPPWLFPNTSRLKENFRI